MWAAMVETVLTPSPARAEVSSTPFFWRNRTFVAMPPTLAGLVLLVNEPANCTRTTGISGILSGTDPWVKALAKRAASGYQ